MAPSLSHPSQHMPRKRHSNSPKCNPPSNGHFLRRPSSKHSPGFLQKLHLVSPAKPPLFTFGLVADIQYAFKDPQIKSCKAGPHGKRLDRRMGWSESLAKVAEAVNTWSEPMSISTSISQSAGVDFILSLGDIIQGNESYMEHLSERELKAVLSQLNKSSAPVKHILGNHCRRISKPKLLPLLGLDASGTYYHFQPAAGWRFICIDTTELCGTAIDATIEEQRHISKHIELYDRPHHKFHGMASETQLEWLSVTLKDAAAHNDHVIIATHYPLKGARESHLALNSEAILRVIEHSNAKVVAVLAGHDHSGAAVLPHAANGNNNNNHHHHNHNHHSSNTSNTAFITMPAMVESPALSNAFATVSVFEDGSLDIAGYGTVPSYRIRSSSNNSNSRRNH